MKAKTWVTCCCCLFLLILMSMISFFAYIRIKARLPKTDSDEQEPETLDDILHKFQESAEIVNNIQKLKKIITEVNEREYIFNYKNNTCLKLDTTVLVIRVHQNISYLTVFLESIRQVSGINGSLLIFAHDYFDNKINSAIRSLTCAKYMQFFYPYSTQVFPNKYPGEDSTFCQELGQCIDSTKRNPVLVQSKLFWWWVANEVFDYINVLKNYTGIVYFLETQHYLSSDFIHIAKTLDQLRPSYCPDCQILSLGAQRPRAEMYYPENSHLIVAIWGWSNYSNSVIGFNRTTWNEIRNLRNYFCHFQDSSWENSLKYLALKTHHRQLYMLVSEAPRFFPITGCGAFRNGTDCDLNLNYHDILRFLPKITHGRYPRNFKLKFSGWSTPATSVVEPRGQWGDARDINMCMFMSNKERHVSSPIQFNDHSCKLCAL